MTISRAQMPRQLYEVGSTPPSMEKMIQTIMEMTGVSREEAIRIIQTMENPQETMGDATMIQEGYQLEPRQEYGLGSIVKSITKGVKKVVSSDLGKAALLAAGAYYAPAMFGGTTGFGPTSTYGSFFRNVGAGMGLGNINPATPLNPTAYKLGSFLGSKKGAAAVLGGTSVLAGIFGTEQEAQELYARDPAEFNARVKQYTKNLNPKESEEVLKQIQTDIAALGDVKKAEQIFTRNLAAEGGIMDTYQGYLSELDNPVYDTAVLSNPNITMFVEDDTNQEGGKITGRNISGYTPSFKDLALTAINPLGGIANMASKSSTGLSLGARVADALGIGRYGGRTTGFGVDDVNEDSVAPDASAGGEAGAAAASAAGANDGPDTGGSFAYGGRVMKEMGGIMGIPTGEMRQNQQGVMERDYRDEGGFVPVGIKEKADDVPAMLSKNEFVFTADAVRGIGDGDVEKGAQILYDNMKRLESRVV